MFREKLLTIEFAFCACFGHILDGCVNGGTWDETILALRRLLGRTTREMPRQL